MRWLGLNAYRFSIAWPRILSRGRGAVNGRGLDFYDALVDALLAAGITPFVTLNHWDTPQALQDEGGWAERRTADAFVHYAGIVAARLGDRVRHWITHNEPWCQSVLGHLEGRHAPGRRDAAESMRVAHHLLVSHGLAAAELRRHAPAAQVGLTLILTPVSAASDSPADRDAARAYDGFFNRWFLDPLYGRGYPADAVADRVRWGHVPDAGLPFVHEGDLATIATPTDFLGVNYYSRAVMRAGPDGRPEGVRMVPPDELTEMGWEVYPSGLHDVLMRVHREYGPRALYVTENGAAFADAVTATGRVEDMRRVDYLRDHLAEARRVIADGAPLRGYFAWSLLDNWEWGQGFAKRFGLFRLDYGTQKRTPKDSAHFYRAVIAARAVPDGSGRITTGGLA
jgi:beta-glucosidase